MKAVIHLEWMYNRTWEEVLVHVPHPQGGNLGAKSTRPLPPLRPVWPVLKIPCACFLRSFAAGYYVVLSAGFVVLAAGSVVLGCGLCGVGCELPCGCGCCVHVFSNRTSVWSAAKAKLNFRKEFPMIVNRGKLFFSPYRKVRMSRFAG